MNDEQDMSSSVIPSGLSLLTLIFIIRACGSQGIYASLDIFPVCQSGVSLLSRSTVDLEMRIWMSQKVDGIHLVIKLTVTALMPHGWSFGINLCAVFLPSFTPVRTLMVRGMSPNALFIPRSIFPSRFGASRTTQKTRLS